ncbi:FIST signal transduction protein [Inquilinus sp. Marseille-Q2685]|uniref:FIST signal transduction protein n=1 Tax=Inquilinus sp. Marseille-Q2685 TaxID=2866581 RepID=UPI001CE41E02|nr:FIST N-terminal domain-containing protein [Inquilinus sp. Marseille-Q2685]
MVAIGHGRSVSAATAIEQCRATLGNIVPQLLLVFCGGKHEGSDVVEALRTTFGDAVAIVGGSAAGVIWRDGLGYSGLEVGVVAFGAEDALPQILVNRDLRQGERAAGFSLGQKLAETAEQDSVVLMFYDSVADPSPLRLHPASDLVEGLQSGLAGHRIRLIGGGTLTDMNLSDAWVLDGTSVAKHAAVALVFPSSLKDETVILHGCRPVSTFMEITRIEGAEVFELDGRPALEVIEQMLGVTLGATSSHDLSLIATLGEKQGDPYAAYDENSYVNRLILRANRTTGSITLFERDFRLGTRVQIMSRDNALMLDSVRNGISAINQTQRDGQPLLAIYIDCAGRASARSGAAIEEARLVADHLDPSIPFLGFYSGVEIAPFDGYSRPLDWTGLLTVLSAR